MHQKEEREREREPFLFNLPNIWTSCDEIRMLFLIGQPRTSERGRGHDSLLLTKKTFNKLTPSPLTRNSENKLPLTTSHPSIRILQIGHVFFSLFVVLLVYIDCQDFGMYGLPLSKMMLLAYRFKISPCQSIYKVSVKWQVTNPTTLN